MVDSIPERTGDEFVIFFNRGMFCRWSLSSYGLVWKNNHVRALECLRLARSSGMARLALIFAEFLVDKQSAWPENL
jgi:hypothetical protein